MIVGIPKEIKDNENRVSTTPSGVHEYVNQHEYLYHDQRRLSGGQHYWEPAENNDEHGGRHEHDSRAGFSASTADERSERTTRPIQRERSKHVLGQTPVHGIPDRLANAGRRPTARGRAAAEEEVRLNLIQRRVCARGDV